MLKQIVVGSVYKDTALVQSSYRYFKAWAKQEKPICSPVEERSAIFRRNKVSSENKFLYDSKRNCVLIYLMSDGIAATRMRWAITNERGFLGFHSVLARLRSSVLS